MTRKTASDRDDLTQMYELSLTHFLNTFLQSFAEKPSVFITSKYTRSTKPNDAVYAWLENISSKRFELCIREFLPFDGKHQDTTVVS